MLPSNLLIARTRRGIITPVYAELTRENLEVAERLIQAYKDHIGAKRGVLKEYIAELEDLGYDYRYVRGLSALLDRRSVFRSKVEVNPPEVRRRVFELAAEDGIPTSLEARRNILEKAGSELGLRAEELEKILYADLEDELFLEDFNPLEAERLVKWYNLALTQTLLFYSMEVKFTALENWQQIFREVKRLRLIYEIWKGEDRYWVKVDGPLSLFKLNRRYGTALARLLPIVVKGGGWTLKAKIVRSSPTGDSRLLDFKIEDWRHGGLLEEDSIQPVGEGVYDSEVEMNFASRFEALKTGWELKREPEPIPVGKTVIIPDFSFKKEEAKVYMEIVGFWTPEYLKRKVEKLEMLKGLDMIVAVDEELACHRVEKLGELFDVIYFKGKIPLKPVLLHLKKSEEQLKDREVEKLSEVTVFKRLDKPVISLDELAGKMRITKEALSEFLRDKSLPGYKTLPGMLIREDKLREIDSSLIRRLTNGRLSLHEASKLIEKLGGVEPTIILETLGYRIKWYGIDPSTAEVEKKK